MRELKEILILSLEATGPVSPDRAIGRLTRVDAMQSQHLAMALRQRQQMRLQRVEQALARIEAGTYGACAKCGDEIAEARLAVAPEATLCIRCAR